MPRFEEYAEKTGLEDEDIAVVYDRYGKATKKFSLGNLFKWITTCLLYTSPSPRD